MRKQTVLRLFFLAEIVAFTGFYFFGTNGMVAVRHLQQESAVIEKQIHVRQQEIEELQTTITAWQSTPFYKEKEAREKLHMGHPEEIIYCLQ